MKQKIWLSTIPLLLCFSCALEPPIERFEGRMKNCTNELGGALNGDAILVLDRRSDTLSIFFGFAGANDFFTATEFDEASEVDGKITGSGHLRSSDETVELDIERDENSLSGKADVDFVEDKSTCDVLVEKPEV